MSAAYLEKLNPRQRSAVEHGIAAGEAARPGPPLLVIAGAGSGKTSTLAHRVAHLIVYTVGLPVFRTLAFTVGFLAQAVLALAIFRVF